ncbi:hypothetical protein N657DRAFT_483151 [Parathielavia appendiculata]|uniref:Uncharacterized protein n=1 Tax=Parathielavia appendiculata TaxID=2587402 RepID=A0AAN6Z3M8_9PEZI|nr:hypothetical protein N657DRAFT_483151 [Parathielavia appendiculata]
MARGLGRSFLYTRGQRHVDKLFVWLCCALKTTLRSDKPVGSRPPRFKAKGSRASQGKRMPCRPVDAALASTRIGHWNDAMQVERQCMKTNQRTARGKERTWKYGAGQPGPKVQAGACPMSRGQSSRPTAVVASCAVPQVPPCDPCRCGAGTVPSFGSSPAWSLCWGQTAGTDRISAHRRPSCSASNLGPTSREIDQR